MKKRQRLPWLRPVLLGASLCFSLPSFAADPACGKAYTIKAGDTLGAIADRVYGTHSKYSAIYYANRDVLTKGPSLIQVGQVISIPCLDASAAQPSTASADTAPAEPAPAPSHNGVRNRKAIRLLTASDYRPFTDQALPAGGMVTEMVETAFKTAGLEYQLTWINDWSAHLSPLLAERSYDMGFPWIDPGCPTDHPRCKFMFSDPVFEMLVALYINKDKPIAFEQDSDIVGKTLCRPAGYFVFDLDANGRNWVKDNKIKLEKPQSVQDCFRMLARGEVDGVTINDFTGREAIAALGLQDQIEAMPREISMQGLQVLVHRTHPRATILLNQINGALRALRENGEYEAILERHLALYWQMIDEASAAQ